MASEVGSAFVSIMPSAKGFGSNLGKVIGGDVQKAGSRGGKTFGTAFARTSLGPVRAGFGGIGKFATGIFAGIGAVNVFKSFIDGARESAKVSAITANAVRSTGKAANLTAEQVGNLATAISNKTGIDDEQIQANENVLLTFTKVRNEVGEGNKIFSRAAIAAQNMATVLGTDASGASIQLGKALNDPVKGITALGRAGVSFTEKQKATIKSLVDQGKVLDAQKIILREVGKEFGGAAAAAATPMDHLRVTLGNVGEAIGAKLIPLVDKGAGGVLAFVEAAKTGKTHGDGFAGAMSNLGGKARSAFNYIRDVAIPAIQDWGDHLKTVWHDILPGITSSVNSLKDSVKILGDALRISDNKASGMSSSFDKTRAAGQLLKGELKLIAVNVRILVEAFKLATLGPRTFARVAIAAIQRFGGAFLDVVGQIIRGAAKAFGWVPGVGPKLRNAAKNFDEFAARARAALSGMNAAGFRAGAQFTAGLAAGIRSNGNVAVATAQGVANKITAAVNSAKGFDSNSPSKKGIQSGRWLIEGVAIGISNATATGVSAAQKMAERVSNALESRLSKAVDRLKSLQDKAKSAFDTAAGGVRGFLDISQIGASVDTEVTTPGATFIDAVTGAVSKTEDLITTLSRVPSPAEVFAGFAANAKAFAQALADMARKKYPISLISAIAGSGNIAAAQALASASPADTASVIAATKQIDAAAGQAGALVQNITVDPKLIASAQKQVAQLTAQNKQLDRVINLLQDANAKTTTATATIRAGDLAIAVAQGQRQNARRG